MASTCKSAPHPRQITMPTSHHSGFLQAGCPSCHPTNRIKALKALWFKLFYVNVMHPHNHCPIRSMHDRHIETERHWITVPVALLLNSHVSIHWLKLCSSWNCSTVFSKRAFLYLCTCVGWICIVCWEDAWSWASRTYHWHAWQNELLVEQSCSSG